MARMYENGSQIGEATVANNSFARGVFDANSVAHHTRTGAWPQYVPPYEPTYRATMGAGVTIWTPFGVRSSSSNIFGNWRVSEFLYTPTSQGLKTFYLGFKMPNSTVSTFYHDMTFTGVQLVRVGFAPSETYQNTSWSGWQTTTGLNSSLTLATLPTSYSYTNLVTGTTANRWNIDSAGTGSSHTGLGAGQNWSGSFPISQSGTGNSIGYTSNTSYVYVETSGAPQQGIFWLRKQFVSTFFTGVTYSIRVAHYYNTSSNYSSDSDAFNNVCGAYIT